MRNIGLHIRITGTLRDVLEKALRLQIPLFQCFLINQVSGDHVQPTDQEVAEFARLRKEHFATTYMHGSYWINLAGVHPMTKRAFNYELDLAKRLEFTHVIVHPGSAKGADDRLQGIDALARTLNTAFKHENSIRCMLENTAHGNMSVGGDLHDFGLLLEKLDHPEKVVFCVDTAHAYSYGYDIVDAAQREKFIDLLDETVGIDKVQLIHLNDTFEKLGSKMDRHQILGAGTIGLEPLKNFMMHPRLRHIPVLLELPVMSEEQEIEMLTMVRLWAAEQ